MNQPSPPYAQPAIRYVTAPPAGHPVQPGVALPAPAAAIRGASLKWTYAALSLAAAALSVTLLLAGPLGLPPEAPAVLRGAAAVCFVSALIVGTVWLARAWAGVPPELVRGLPASEAVLRLFIPFYGFFWMFAVHARLCDALDAVLPRGPMRAPKSVGMVAAAVWLVAGLGPAWSDVGYGLAPAVASFFWFLYMLRCDRVRRATAAFLPRR